MQRVGVVDDLRVAGGVRVMRGDSGEDTVGVYCRFGIKNKTNSQKYLYFRHLPTVSLEMFHRSVH